MDSIHSASLGNSPVMEILPLNLSDILLPGRGALPRPPLKWLNAYEIFYKDSGCRESVSISESGG